jgi:pyruvate formate lyase activating enzyme
VATVGCNFQCAFCQNWDISQYGRVKGIRATERDVAPEKVVRAAAAEGCASISYTYSEPTIFFEYAYDIGRLARAAGIRNVFVTNGYLSPEAIEQAGDFLDAANVDLKAFREATYRKWMKAQLKGVTDSIERLKKQGVWLEITTLVVPGMNDDPAEITDMAQFVASVGREIPWHLSRFHPDFEFDRTGPTPLATLERAYQAGKDAGLKYVYLGNVPGHDGENTRCGACDARLIHRTGYRIHENRIGKGSGCPECGAVVEGFFGS